MRYYIDCEFDGMGGPLLSMAIVSETSKSMYVVMGHAAHDPWVLKNVIPILLDAPMEKIDGPLIYGASPTELSKSLEIFFAGDLYPYVIADWPDDIKYLCDALITGPGTMIDIPGMQFGVARVDAYPTKLPGAIQHNAWWDAMALRYHFIKHMATESAK